jgi:predicted ester cyclase
MSVANPKATVLAFLDAVNRQDWLALDELTTEDFARHQSGSPLSVRSREDLKAFLRSEAVTFPDAHERVNFLIGEGDKIAAHITFHGTQSGPLGPFPPSNLVHEADFICIFEVTDGRVSAAWVAWDSLHMLEALGHLGQRTGGEASPQVRLL